MAWIKGQTDWASRVRAMPYQFDPHLRVPGLKVEVASLRTEIAALFQRRPPVYWRSQPPGAVYGLSLTFNPQAPPQEWGWGSFGHPRYQAFNSFDYFKAPERDSATAPRGDYLDSLSFRNFLPEIKDLPALNALLNSFLLPVVRCTVRVVDGMKVWPSREDGGGMHKDDSPYEVLRLNLCITGSEDFGLQYAEHDPMILSSGEHQVVNTDTDHRVWIRQRSPLQRLHLVIGLVPWLDYDAEADIWAPNKHFGRTHPYDLVRQGLILKSP
jgi:hypothetical protein